MTQPTPHTNANANAPMRSPSFTAYPLGAWSVSIVAACMFLITSPHPERFSIWNILIAASMAIATLGGTAYGLMLFALKRGPKFKTSFILGSLCALICMALAFAVARMTHNALLPFATIGLFIVLSGILAWVTQKNNATL